MSEFKQWFGNNKLFLILVGIGIVVSIVLNMGNLDGNKKIEINQAFELIVPSDFLDEGNGSYGTLKNKDPDNPVLIYYECAWVTNPILIPESEFIQNKEWTFRDLANEEGNISNEFEQSQLRFSKTYQDKITQQWVALFFLDTMSIKIPVSLPEEYTQLSVKTRVSNNDEFRLILPKNESDSSHLAGLYIHSLNPEETKMSLSLVAHTANKDEIDLLKHFFETIIRK
jgi:hypothetical protein